MLNKVTPPMLLPVSSENNVATTLLEVRALVYMFEYSNAYTVRTSIISISEFMSIISYLVWSEQYLAYMKVRCVPIKTCSESLLTGFQYDQTQCSATSL